LISNLHLIRQILKAGLCYLFMEDHLKLRSFSECIGCHIGKREKKWFEQVLCKGFNYVSHICAQKERSYNGTIRCTHRPRGFNDSVNIPESCGFRSQFDPLNIICQIKHNLLAFSIKYYFVGIYILN